MPESTPLGPYLLHQRLGAGGMGEVWAATRNLPGGVAQDVVIKRVRAERAADPRFASRFLDEARIAARLTHPNLVRVLDFGEHDGTWYLALERVHGADLARVLRGAGGPLPAPLALTIAHEVARGLEAAHSSTDASGRPLHLVHRDVCAANVLIGTDGSVRLTDFGVAALAQDDDGSEVVGHLATMSPEQIERLPVDARSDLFSLGVVLYQMLTGTLPFGNTEPERLRAAITSAPLRPASTLGAPPALDALLAQALARDPADRFPTATAMREALRAALHPSAPDLQATALAALLPGWLAPQPSAESAVTVVDPVSAPTVLGALDLGPRPHDDLPDLPEIVLPEPEPPVAPAPPAPTRRAGPVALAALALLAAGAVVLWQVGTSPPPQPVQLQPVSVSVRKPAPTAPAAEAAPAAPARSEGTKAEAPESEAPQAEASPSASAEPAPPPAAEPAAPAQPAPSPAPEERDLPRDALADDPPSTTEAAVAAADLEALPEDPPADLRADPTDPGTLSVRVASRWGWVRVDGKKIKGTTPIEDLQLPPGTHTVRVETPSTRRVYHRDVTITPGQHTVLVIED